MRKPILILGATGGIGSALARVCKDEGVSTILAARSQDRLQRLADELDSPAHVVDVRDEAALRATVEAAAAPGGLGGLAYCVGSIPLRPLTVVTGAMLAEAFELNATGAAIALAAAAPHLKSAQGAALLFSTVAVGQGFPLHAIIAAAKGAVEGLTRAAAAELAPQVRVNCIAPSLTRTPLAAPILANEKIEAAIAAAHPINRLGEAEDAAALAAFLLGPRAGWITGQVIHVDGGRSALRMRGQ